MQQPVLNATTTPLNLWTEGYTRTRKPNEPERGYAIVKQTELQLPYVLFDCSPNRNPSLSIVSLLITAASGLWQKSPKEKDANPLMGTFLHIHSYNLSDSTRQRIKFDDDRVCKSHLLNCCPHDILSGTRMDLGECSRVHDLALRADYEIATKQRDFFFELDAADHLQSFIADCDRRTEVAKKRLAETQEEINAEVAAKAERVHELNEEIGKLLAKAEQLGAEGNVDEAQKVLEEVEKARVLKREAEEIYKNSMPASSFQQQKLRVCEVCSAYLGLHDNDRRLADHFGGKLHLGFIEIREKLDKLKKKVSEKQEQRSLDRIRRRDDREEREKLKRRSSKDRSPREKDRHSKDKSQDRRERKRSCSSTNGKSSSEEREAGEI
ncbi:LC7L2 protein, partial [Polypterus senegalus]|nr:LC7L2 protein [Polypterus senegalus]